MKTLMKTLGMALVAAVLVATQLFSPVAAATLNVAAEDCGDTYTVQPHDYLVLIARTCGLSLSEILALNPQITNANIIYSGQLIRLTGSASSTSYWPTYYSPYSTSYTASNGTATIGLSTVHAAVGDQVTVSVSGFPANAQIDYRVGAVDESYSLVYDGTTNSSGSDSETITIPNDASSGEYWVVQVATTGLKNVVEVTSRWIYIGSYSTTTTTTTTTSSSAQVSLSDTSVVAGDTIKVTLSGFPARADVDYRVGERGESFSTVYDGSIDSSGAGSITITIPSSANEGEYWIVQVATTSQVTGNVTVTSHSIYITD